MRICEPHWIECRQYWEASNDLIGVVFAAQMILLESDSISHQSKSLKDLQDKVHAENGCTICYFVKYDRQGWRTAIQQKLDSFPPAERQTMRQKDIELRDKNQHLRGQ